MTENTCPSCHRPLPPDAPGGLCPACVLLGAREEAAPPGLPPIEEIRALLPQFEILECIGRGGMGAVYKARQPQLDRIVALKILLPGLERDPGFAERFAREARALAKLSHPHIVAVHDFGESGGLFWLTMEYVDGVNLRQAMRAARFTPAQALAIIPELCSALQYAHDHGILHRDIKPENILLDSRGKVKVADFGIVRMAGENPRDATLTMTGAALGTTAYVAPEQIENPRAVDHRADLYSLGVVLYEMLTGELPLGRFPAPSERSTSDPRLDEVVFRSLEKQPEKRYQQAEEFSNKVAGAASAAPTQALPEPPAVRGKTSVTAVVAAAVTAFSLALGLPILSAFLWARMTDSRAGFGFQELLVILVGVVVPALTGMLLGAVSWVRIKDSQGALRGLPLAQFATLAWPAVVVLAVIPGRQMVAATLLLVGVIYYIARSISRSGARSQHLAGPASSVRRVDPVGVHADLPRHLPWTFGLLIVAAILIGAGIVAKNFLVVVPGLCALALGFAGGWWALWKMKRGHLPLTGRHALLFLLVWLPLLGGALTGAFVLADAALPELAVKGGFIAKTILLFLATFIVAALAFTFTALPKNRDERKSPPRRLLAGLSVILALASLLAAKRYDGHWPAANFMGRKSMTLERPFPWTGPTGPALEQGSAEFPVTLYPVAGEHRTAPLPLKDSMGSDKSPLPGAFRVAAGDYADRIAISYELSSEGKYAHSPTLYFMTRNEAEWNELWVSFCKRLIVALPPEAALPMNSWYRMEMVAGIPRAIRVESFEHFVISSCIMVTAVLSAILGAWCLFPLASFPLAGALLAAVAAYATPLWPDQKFDAPLIDGPPLAPLERRVAVIDFTTPVAAGRTVCDAAWAGDIELMKRGISKRWRTLIDGRDGWEQVIEHLSQRAIIKVYKDQNSVSQRDRIYRQTAVSGGPLDMTFEDGEWRLDEVPFVFR